MAYTAWSVVYGEQPTAAKWNQLGANDAGFKDGTNIDAGAITFSKLNAASIISAQQSWITPTLTNGWVNYAGGFEGAAYFKDSLGIVHMRGMVKSGTMGAQIFNLPAGYRPSGAAYHPSVSNTNPGIISIDSAGIVKADGGSNGYISLAGVHFRAEL